MLISEPSAVAFASATLNALAAKRGGDLHTAVLYAVDDEDAEDMLERLNASVDPKAETPAASAVGRGGSGCADE